jgi:hypothetical protein
MDELTKEMRVRAQDTRSYLKMLKFIEEKQASLVAHNKSESLHIDTRLFQTMKANVFLHLYNLVESTVNACLRRVGEQIRDDKLSYERISNPWRDAWVKHVIKGEQPLGQKSRLECVIKLCDQVLNSTIVDFRPQNNSGNLDDKIIEDVAEEYGVNLNIRKVIRKSIKRFILDEKGFLEIVRQSRNDLAHGLISFAECGKNWATTDLEKWIDTTAHYLEDVINSFGTHIVEKGYARQP